MEGEGGGGGGGLVREGKGWKGEGRRWQGYRWQPGEARSHKPSTPGCRASMPCSPGYLPSCLSIRLMGALKVLLIMRTLSIVDDRH